jgi:hypothetical protein
LLGWVFYVFSCHSASNPFVCTFLPSLNTGSLHLDHFQWQDDSIVVYFAHQKNNQQGKRTALHHHLFCTPFKEYVCPVFAIDLWIASKKDIMMSGGPLFPGSNHQLWFNKLFWAFLTENADLVRACRCDPELLGVHYFHKGSIAFMSSGFTASSTSGAIHPSIHLALYHVLN